MPHDEELQHLIRELYAVTSRLENLYPGRHFTPDGHMIGSLGEVIAADAYGLKLFDASHPVHDAVDQKGRLVQIKATQGSRVALSEKPDYLIVLSINTDGSFAEIFNGPGSSVWEACGKLQKTGQRQISLSKLKELAKNTPNDERITRNETNYYAE